MALLAATVAAASCQTLAGIDEKELDPKYSDSGVVPLDGPAEATWDAGPPLNGSSATVPPRPTGQPIASGTGVKRWFAARRIFLGTVDPATEKKDDSAWRRIGHAIDSEDTTQAISIANASKVCKRPSAASDESLVDGENGRDNGAGRVLAYGSQFLSADFELGLEADLESGDKPTMILMLEDLDPGSDDPYVPGALLVSAVNPGQNPKWNGSDDFWIDEKTIADPSAEAGADAGADASIQDAGDADSQPEATAKSVIEPRYLFPKGYLKNNIWVSGEIGSSPAQLPMFVLKGLTIVDAETVTLAVELTPLHDAAVRSTLSAVASKATLEAEFYPLAQQMVGCNDTLAALFMGQFLLPAMDVANNPPSFENSGQPCDALGIGFAFDWRLIVEPTVAVTVPEPAGCN